MIVPPRRFDTGLLNNTDFWTTWDPSSFTGIPERFVLDTAMPSYGFVREWMDYMMPLTQGNLAYHLAMGVCLMSSCIPPHIKTLDGDGHPANFFCMLVGPSSWGKKTFAVSRAEDLVQEVSPAKLLPITAASSEGLLEEMVARPHGRIAMVREGATFLSHTSGDYGAKVRHMLNEVFDGKQLQARLTVSTKKQQKAAPTEPTIALTPRASFAIACTPRHIQEYTFSLDWEAGFQSRICVIEASPERIRKGGAGLDNEGWARMKRLYNNASSIGTVAECAGTTDEAWQYWDAWQTSYVPPHGVVSEFLQSIVDRAQIHAKRAALSLAYARHVHPYISGDGSPEHAANLNRPWMIQLEDLQVGCALAAMHIASARHLVLSIGQTEFSRYFHRVANLLRQKAAEGQKSVSRMMILNELGLEQKKGEGVISSMLTMGKIIPVATEFYGNRMEPRFELNPYTTEKEICEFEARRVAESMTSGIPALRGTIGEH